MYAQPPQKGKCDFDWQPALIGLQLSPQQLRITLGILAGKGDKQIAAELGIGFSTLRTYLNRIFQRLGVADRTQLLLRVFASARTGTALTDDRNDDGKVADSNHDVILNTDLFSSPLNLHTSDRARGTSETCTEQAHLTPPAAKPEKARKITVGSVGRRNTRGRINRKDKK